MFSGNRQARHPGSLEHVHDGDDLTVRRTLVRLQNDRRIGVLLHVLLHDRRRFLNAHRLIVDRDVPFLVERHDDRQLCGCGRTLRLRQLHGKRLLRDRLQAVHHEEHEQEEDDVNHRDDHKDRLFSRAMLTEVHASSQLSFFAPMTVEQRRSVSVTSVSS